MESIKPNQNCIRVVNRIFFCVSNIVYHQKEAVALYKKPTSDVFEMEIFARAWRIIFFFSQNVHLYNFIFWLRGTSGIDIDLRKVDINQCPTLPQEGDEQIEKGAKINIFGGTDKCKPETTKVSIY